jgi:hypothetical protein
MYSVRPGNEYALNSNACESGLHRFSKRYVLTSGLLVPIELPTTSCLELIVCNADSKSALPLLPSPVQ